MAGRKVSHFTRRARGGRKAPDCGHHPRVFPRRRAVPRRIQAVPADLGETYEAVYRLIRSGGYLPSQGRWITGQTPTPTDRAGSHAADAP